jgi:4-hydroxysphinganine ceramide fatty acyl 2-hydroxylase
MPFQSEVVAGLCWFIYACFFEWVGHRYFMHAPRFPLKDAFRGHMAHHQHYRGDHYEAHEEGHVEGVTLRWYAFPLMILAHMPLFAAVQWLTGVPSFWGGVVACTLYFAGYEYTHYLMHVPRGHFVERFRWFRFTREHHRLHHEYMRCNFNVFIPLADACLGTLRTQPKPRKAARGSTPGQ